MKKSTLTGLIVLMSILLLAVIAIVTITVISQIKLSDEFQATVSEQTEGTDTLSASGNETAGSPLTLMGEDTPDDESLPESDNGKEETVSEVSANVADTNDKPSKSLNVVWLGDSLTQGSLGGDNGNVNNPQAPWRVLKELSGYNVEGFGYYALPSHDILWKWSNDGGEKDPDTIYVFWVGSCDFRDSVDNIDNVINDIDFFLYNGILDVVMDKYIVLGTTPRLEIGVEGAEYINKRFEEKYGEKFINILPYVEFGPDSLHLTAESYHKIAEVVYEKIKELYQVQ